MKSCAYFILNINIFFAYVIIGIEAIVNLFTQTPNYSHQHMKMRLVVANLSGCFFINEVF